MKEDRQAYVDEIKRAGKLTEFTTRMGELVHVQGMNRDDAWKMACMEFSRLLGWIKDTPEGPRPTAVRTPAPSIEPPPVLPPQTRSRPPAEPQPAVAVGEFASKADFEGKDATTYRQDILWVYGHISILDVTPRDAPSPGAWYLLNQARKDDKVLREGLLLIARTSGAEDDEQEKSIQRQGRETEAELDALLERIGSGQYTGI